MIQKGQFTRIGKSEELMYGPRGLLVCGYPQEERDDFLKLVDKIGLVDMRVVFACSHDFGEKVGNILTYENKAGFVGESDMPRAVIMSGLTRNELHLLMAAYREAGFIRQLWATLTIHSEGWPLQKLLQELLAEHEAIKNKKKG